MGSLSRTNSCPPAEDRIRDGRQDLSRHQAHSSDNWPTTSDNKKTEACQQNGQFVSRRELVDGRTDMDKEQTSFGQVAVATDKCKHDQTVANGAGRPTDHVTTDPSANGRPVLVSTSERSPEADCAHALRRMSSFVPPDGGWGWAVVAGSFIAFFLSGGLSRSFTLIYQHMLEEFGQSAAATSATAALFGAVKMCTSPLVSMMCVKFSKRVIAVLGGLITGVAMVLTSFPLSLPYIYVTYGFMAALGVNMILTPVFIIISEYFKKRRARAMSLAMLGASFGGVALPPLLTHLFSWYDYSGAMLILAGLMFHLCLTGAVFRPVQHGQSRLQTDENQNSAAMDQEHPKTDDEDSDYDDDTDDEDEDGDTDDSCRLDDERHFGDEQEDISERDCASWRCNTAKFNPKASQDRRSSGHSNGSAKEEVSTLYASGKHKLSSTVTFEDQSRKDSNVSASTYPEGLGPKYLSHYERIAELAKRRVSFQIGGKRLTTQNSCSTTETDYGAKTCCPCLNSGLSYFGVRLLRQPRFVFYSLLMMGSILSLSVSGTFVAGLVLDLGFDEKHTGIMLSASAVAAIPSRSLSGIVFDLKRARPYRSFLLTALGFLTGTFSFTMGFCAGYVQLFVVYVTYSFFASAYHTHHATVLADIVRRRDVSRAMGLCRLFQGIGFIIGPIVGGFLRDATGHYQNAYMFSGAVLVTFTLLYTLVEVLLLWKRKLRKKRDLPKGYVARCRADSIWSNI